MMAEANLVDDVAGRADRLAARLAAADTDELVEDAKDFAKKAADFARKEPVLVIAGAFTLGLLAPKVPRSSRRKPQSSKERGSPNDTGPSGSQSTIETVTQKAGDAASAVGTVPRRSRRPLPRTHSWQPPARRLWERP